VGRPDLLERAAGYADTMEAGARTLFHSLERFRALPDHLQVWPAHGAGSACGKALGAVPSSTVGYEKLSNWGVAETDEARFVAAVLDGQPEPPRYFAEMKRINRDGPPVLHGVPVPPPLDATSTPVRASTAWLIVLRPAAVSASAHIPGALSIPYSKSFSTYTGSLVPYDVDIILLADSDATPVPAAVRAAAHDLTMIGLDRVVGWMDVAAAERAWQAAGGALATIPQCDADTLRAGSLGPVTVVDVRGETEWRGGHLPGAMHIPLGDLPRRLQDLPSTPLVVQCQAGGRSAIAASVLARAGRTDVTNLIGGYTAWLASGGSPA
jgi:hydroxyacylglutathione hydrolase